MDRRCLRRGVDLIDVPLVGERVEIAKRDVVERLGDPDPALRGVGIDARAVELELAVGERREATVAVAAEVPAAVTRLAAVRVGVVAARVCDRRHVDDGHRRVQTVPAVPPVLAVLPFWPGVP